MTRNPLKPLKFSVELLNSAPYQDPDGIHSYVIAPSSIVSRDLLHIEGCPVLDQATERRAAVSTYKEATSIATDTLGCTRCQPHAFTHVTLPDGTKRYRPAGPILSGGDDSDPRYGKYALVNQSGGRWQVREWAATGQDALDRASKLGITVILGEVNEALGLPTSNPS
ncbi:hypothetical protein AB0L53_47000 [Nonomuraea sp. NPDC052129]|uniref:hypothetical protein n=1 Tax=Nonomuraea sp. NPDC052129 TaxID=3154651 RepID=UPI0034183CF9